MAKACELIRQESESGDKLSVKSLAKEVGLTESHFCRVFKKVMGMTIGEYRSLVHPKLLEVLSKKDMAPSIASHNATTLSPDDVSGSINTEDWEPSFAQYPLDLDQNWSSSTTCAPWSPNFFSSQLFGLDHLDLEMPLDDLSSQPILGSWDDVNEFINYDSVF